MARKKEKKEQEVDTGAWLDTYGDMVTLLLTFFVLLLASTSVDNAKLKAIASYFNPSISFINGGETIGEGSSIGNGISVMPNYEQALNETETEEQAEIREKNEQMVADFKTYIQENNLTNKIEVGIEDDEVKITFNDNILFDKSKADLKPEAIEILDKLSEQLLKYPDTNIKVEGHTDSDQIHTALFPSNWELSAYRAISVAKYYINVKGFSPERMSTEGYGEYRPVASNDTIEGKAKNRRVEIKITQKESSNQRTSVQ